MDTAHSADMMVMPGLPTGQPEPRARGGQKPGTHACPTPGMLSNGPITLILSNSKIFKVTNAPFSGLRLLRRLPCSMPPPETMLVSKIRADTGNWVDVRATLPWAAVGKQGSLFCSTADDCGLISVNGRHSRLPQTKRRERDTLQTCGCGRESDKMQMSMLKCCLSQMTASGGAGRLDKPAQTPRHGHHNAHCFKGLAT
jgi:hypothetical protein